MIELLIISSGCALGYMLNKNGKQNRESKNPITISSNRKPLGPVIYDNNRVSEVDDYVRSLAAKKHSQRVKQMFPVDYDKPINIYPNDMKSDQPTRLLDISGGYGTAGEKLNMNIKQALSKNINVAAYNPQTGVALETNFANVETSPMFRPPKFIEQTSEFEGPKSLLTGLPLDMTHANMNPMYGKNTKQVSLSNENSQVLLEKYTGIPSTDNQGTYSMKREIENSLPNNPENFQRANISQVKDLYERAETFVKPSHEYKTPVKSFRDLPMKVDARVMPMNIDEVRGVNKKQVTYSGIMVPGQKGSTRPMLPSIKSNRWDMTKEQSNEDLIANRSFLQGSQQQVVPSIRDVNATFVAENGYMAPPSNWRKYTNTSSDMYKAQMDTQVNRRMEPFTPGYGPAHGQQRATNTGVFMMKDPDKGFATNRHGQPHHNKGSRVRDNVDVPEFTLRDTVAESSAGTMNIHGLKHNTAWEKANLRLDPTNKAMNAHNTYRGLPHKNLGMGNRKHKIQPWVTTKETTEFSKQGNPKGLIPAHMSYDAVFDVDTNKTIETDHYGIAKNRIMASVPDGGERTVSDMEKLMVVDYTTNPKGVSKGRDRERFVDSVEMDYNRVDFGGYFSAGKIGNGDDANRKSEVTIKDEMVVNGRMNVPMKHDNMNDHLDIEANLRPEKDMITRSMMQRTLPSQVVTERDPLLTRTKNSEVINPRLDINTKITLTSDYCPWIKNKDDSDG